MIEVTELKKHFGKTEAVRGVSFSVKKGSIVGLLGPNGAGKTTTMRMITGFYDPSSGSVKIKDLPIQDHRQEVKKIMGYLPESSCTYADMLVCDYLDFVADSRQLNGDNKKRGIQKAVESASLEEYYYKPISKLSKGYKQRVGLASTLVHDPEILILDEPTSSLDPNQIREIQKLIRDLSSDKTIILSTHILSEVESTCERTIIIDRGKIVLDKPLNEISELKKGNMSYRVTLKGQKNTALNAYEKAFSKGGESVELLSRNSATTALRIVAKANIGERAFQTAVEENFVLTELYAEKNTLEDVFTSLTAN